LLLHSLSPPLLPLFPYTTLFRSRVAPILITDEMLAVMKPGSVIVDLAVEAGGNVTQSKLGEIVTTANGVKIVGHHNVPSRLASEDRKSTRLNSSHVKISYAVFC